MQLEISAFPNGDDPLDFIRLKNIFSADLFEAELHLAFTGRHTLPAPTLNCKVRGAESHSKLLDCKTLHWSITFKLLEPSFNLSQQVFCWNVLEVHTLPIAIGGVGLEPAPGRSKTTLLETFGLQRRGSAETRDDHCGSFSRPG